MHYYSQLLAAKLWTVVDHSRLASITLTVANHNTQPVAEDFRHVGLFPQS